MKKITKLKLLTVCIFLAQHSHALERLNDSSLRAYPEYFLRKRRLKKAKLMN